MFRAGEFAEQKELKFQCRNRKFFFKGSQLMRSTPDKIFVNCFHEVGRAVKKHKLLASVVFVTDLVSIGLLVFVRGYHFLNIDLIQLRLSFAKQYLFSPTSRTCTVPETLFTSMPSYHSYFMAFFGCRMTYSSYERSIKSGLHLSRFNKSYHGSFSISVIDSAEFCRFLYVSKHYFYLVNLTWIFIEVRVRRAKGV